MTFSSGERPRALWALLFDLTLLEGRKKTSEVKPVVAEAPPLPARNYSLYLDGDEAEQTVNDVLDSIAADEHEGQSDDAFEQSESDSGRVESDSSSKVNSECGNMKTDSCSGRTESDGDFSKEAHSAGAASLSSNSCDRIESGGNTAKAHARNDRLLDEGTDVDLNVQDEMCQQTPCSGTGSKDSAKMVENKSIKCDSHQGCVREGDTAHKDNTSCTDASSIGNKNCDNKSGCSNGNSSGCQLNESTGSKESCSTSATKVCSGNGQQNRESKGNSCGESKGGNSCGNKGDNSCGSKEDNSCGSKEDNSCGSKGDNSCGSKGDNSCGSKGEKSAGESSECCGGVGGEDSCLHVRVKDSEGREKVLTVLEKQESFKVRSKRQQTHREKSEGGGNASTEGCSDDKTECLSNQTKDKYTSACSTVTDTHILDVSESKLNDKERYSHIDMINSSKEHGDVSSNIKLEITPSQADSLHSEATTSIVSRLTGNLVIPGFIKMTSVSSLDSEFEVDTEDLPRLEISESDLDSPFETSDHSNNSKAEFDIANESASIAQMTESLTSAISDFPGKKTGTMNSGQAGLESASYTQSVSENSSSSIAKKSNNAASSGTEHRSENLHETSVICIRGDLNETSTAARTQVIQSVTEAQHLSVDTDSCAKGRSDRLNKTAGDFVQQVISDSIRMLQLTGDGASGFQQNVASDLGVKWDDTVSMDSVYKRSVVTDVVVEKSGKQDAHLKTELVCSDDSAIEDNGDHERERDRNKLMEGQKDITGKGRSPMMQHHSQAVPLSPLTDFDPNLYDDREPTHMSLSEVMRLSSGESSSLPRPPPPSLSDSHGHYGHASCRLVWDGAEKTGLKYECEQSGCKHTFKNTSVLLALSDSDQTSSPLDNSNSNIPIANQNATTNSEAPPPRPPPIASGQSQLRRDSRSSQSSRGSLTPQDETLPAFRSVYYLVLCCISLSIKLKLL